MATESKPKTVLVTGGAGFVGSNLCERLLKDGDRVICVDNMFTGSVLNIRHLQTDPNFKLVIHDITNPYQSEEKIDQIYNLACPSGPGHFLVDPIKTFTTALFGTLNMLELAKQHKARFFQASTAEVYGEPTVDKIHESYRGNIDCTGPRACYDEAKRAAETVCFDYWRMYKLQIRVARIFNTYGPKMHPYHGRVISNFIRQAIRGEDITIYGSGNQQRCFLYIDDLIEGMIRFMNSKDEDFIGPVNLGQTAEFTMNHLADLIMLLTNANSNVIYKPLPADYLEKRRPDISLAEEKLGGWRPKMGFLEGLRRTVHYFQGIDINKYPPLRAGWSPRGLGQNF